MNTYLIPIWDKYFDRFAHNQYILYSQINDETKPKIHKLYEAYFKGNLHSIWGSELHYIRKV